MPSLKGHSLLGQIVIRVILCVFSLWLVGAVFAAIVINEELGEAFDTGLQETAKRTLPLAVQFFMNSPEHKKSSHLPAASSNNETMPRTGEYLIYQLRDSTGKVVLRSHETSDTPFPAPLVSGFWEDDAYRYYTEETVSRSLFLQVAEPMEHRREATLESSVVILLPLIILIPAIVGAIWFSVRTGLVPVRQLRDEISLRGGGNLDPIALTQTPQELSDMVRAINMLLTRLRSALNAERGFAANSAHELRTPVASALAQTQQLLLEIAPNSPVRERALKVESSLNRLGRLSEKLLQWSRAESGAGRSTNIHQLNPIIRMVIEDIVRSNRYANHILIEQDDISLLAAIDPDAFGICLRNLLENALLYGSGEEPVRVHIIAPNKFSIDNAGPVIPADLLGRLCNRFERHGNHTESTGLGLSITTTILSQAGGKLELASPRPGKPDGFSAIVTLETDTTDKNTR